MGEKKQIDRERGRRLRRTRIALGKQVGLSDGKEFAEAIGWSKQQLNNYELGQSIPESAAAHLCSKFPGLTRDFIQAGKPDGLSWQMFRTLGLLPKGSVSGG
jgi:transcriptional regulator with XRE-family HTH domain